ncbi:hypothetical protein, partial [Thermus scotoductus]|uniref:hypothetical protein n=1 Tax=Thermus scotoductus TaxID=37636 RepID=UPI001C129E9E
LRGDCAMLWEEVCHEQGDRQGETEDQGEKRHHRTRSRSPRRPQPKKTAKAMRKRATSSPMPPHRHRYSGAGPPRAPSPGWAVPPPYGGGTAHPGDGALGGPAPEYRWRWGGMGELVALFLMALAVFLGWGLLGLLERVR